MSDQLKASIVRISQKASKELPIGVGFLAYDKYILTCAHVVMRALDLQESFNMPNEPIYFDFPFIAPERTLTARVVYWQPGEKEDIAILEAEMNLPNNTSPVRLITTQELWGHSFRAFGFPPDYDNGVWTSGIMRDQHAKGWIQIEAVNVSGYRVAQGFSGTPVWDEQLNGVVGMVVEVDRQEDVKAAYIIPTSLLMKTWPKLNQQAILPCPYRGLFAFREQDHPFFFGRETFANQLLERIQNNPLCVVIGPSGSGKSSLVFAGLLPHLRQIGNWLIISFRPSSDPFHSLVASLISLLEPHKSEVDRLLEINKLVIGLQQGKVTLQNILDRITKQRSVSHLLLVVDQFEELYTSCEELKAQQRFLDILLAIVQKSSPYFKLDFHLLITLRADFFGHVLSSRSFSDMLQHATLNLSPMTRQELQDAIQKPAQKLHVRIEDGLTERILYEIDQKPGSLPLLEFSLAQLWMKHQSNTLTHKAYTEIGGLERGLARYAEEIYNKFDTEEQERVSRIFVQLVRPGEGTEDTRRLANRAEIGEENWDIVTRLSDERLVISSRDMTTGKENVEVVHEALIKGWERLQLWIESYREFRLWQERLRIMLHEWERGHQHEDTVLRGYPLIEAEKKVKDHPKSLSKDENDFINASIGARERQEAAKRKSVTRLRFFVGALSILLTVTVALASLAGVSFQKAESALDLANMRKQSAQSRALAANSNYYLLNSQVDLSLLLGQKAYQTANNYDSRNALFDALTYSSQIASMVNIPTDQYLAADHLSLSADGRTVFLARSDGTIATWDLMGKKYHTWHLKLADSLRIGSFPEAYVTISPNSKMVAISEFGNLELWNIETGQQLLLLEDLPYKPSIRTMAFSPDGNTLVLAKEDSSLTIWNFKSRRYYSTPPIDASSSFYYPTISSLGFSSDGKFLALGGCNHYDVIAKSRECVQGRILLWDMEGKRITGLPFIGHQGLVNDVSFSPNGQIVASGSSDGTIILWNAATGESIGDPLVSTQGAVNCITFSANGSLLASGGQDTTVRVWDVAKRLPISNKPLVGHRGPVISVVFSSDGQQVVASGFDPMVISWNVAAIGPIEQRVGESTPLIGVAYSPDGHWIATCDDQRHVILWKVDSGRIVGEQIFNIPDSFIPSVAILPRFLDFSPNSQRLIIGNADGPNGIIAFDIPSKTFNWSFTDSTSSLEGIAFSSDSKILASIDSKILNDTITLRDANTGNILKQISYPIPRENRNYTNPFQKSQGSNIAFSRDGKMLATAFEDGSIVLFDMATKKAIGSPIINQYTKEGINEVTFSPDSHTLASANFGGTITLYNVLTRTPVGQPFTNEQVKRFDSIAFSPNGEKLVSVGSDNKGKPSNILILWDVSSHEALVHPYSYEAGILPDGANFSPDGQYMVSLGNGILTLLNINMSTWSKVACIVANRNFTVSEWKQFISDEPYQKICSILPN